MKEFPSAGLCSNRRNGSIFQSPFSINTVWTMELWGEVGRHIDLELSGLITESDASIETVSLWTGEDTWVSSRQLVGTDRHPTPCSPPHPHPRPSLPLGPYMLIQPRPTCDPCSTWWVIYGTDSSSRGRRSPQETPCRGRAEPAGCKRSGFRAAWRVTMATAKVKGWDDFSRARRQMWQLNMMEVSRLE